MSTARSKVPGRNPVSRAVNQLRFAPGSYLLSLRHREKFAEADRVRAREFADFMGQPGMSPAGTGRLVVLSFLPLHYTAKIELVLARLLQERGWKISVVTTRATEMMAREYFRKSNADVLRFEDFLTFERNEEIAEFVTNSVTVARRGIAEFKALTYRRAPIAQNVIASLTAIQPDGSIGTDPRTCRRIARLLRQSALLVDASENVFRNLRPTTVLCQEKGFVGTCEPYYAALNNAIDYVQWVSCHEPDSVMFKRYNLLNARAHPFSISDAAWAAHRDSPWNEDLEKEVFSEFNRGYKSGDWFKYKKLGTNQTFPERQQLVARLALAPEKKTAVIYSHILNDANLFYGVDLFPSGYEQWLVETVRAASSNSSVNWVLKLHPANVFRNARMGYHGEYGELIALKRAFGRVPPFLTIVRPEETVSPLSFFGISDWGITVRGTVGLELPCFGVPVLTAGSGRYSSKGFTEDSDTSAEYLRKIRSIHMIPPLTEEQRRLAVLHAYLVFSGRPARYGDVFEDFFPVGADTRQRDLRVKKDNSGAVLVDPQIEAMARFLESREEDFLDPAIRRSEHL